MEDVRVLRVFDAQGHVVLQFAMQALADLAAGDELAFAADQRRGVHLEVHGQRRLVDRDGLEAFGGDRVADGDADVHIRQAGDGHDVAGAGAVDRVALKAGEGQHLGDLARALVLIAVAHDNLLADLDRAAADAADADATDVRVVVQLRDLQLQRAVGIGLRGRRVLEDGFEQRAHVWLRGQVVGAGPALQGRGVDDREVQLLVGGAELVEQVEGLVDDPARTRARTVDLVHHHDGLEAQAQGLAGDEARLRHRAFDRVHQQQHAVDHRQHALDFAAEVSMARGVDDVDAEAAVLDGAVLRQDRDATFLFNGVGVHDPLAHLFVGGEGSGLLEQAIDEGRLAVVNVGDNGDVADRSIHGGNGSGRGRGAG